MDYIQSIIFVRTLSLRANPRLYSSTSRATDWGIKAYRIGRISSLGARPDTEFYIRPDTGYLTLDIRYAGPNADFDIQPDIGYETRPDILSKSVSNHAQQRRQIVK